MLTIPILCAMAFIAINFSNISDYFSILGGFCCVIISFLFPGFLYIKNNDYPISHWKNFGSLILMAIVTLIGFTAGISTIVDLFKTNKKNH